MLAAAQRTLNPPGEGSSPSGPTEMMALVVQWRGYRTRNAATRVRVRAPTRSVGLVLLLFDNSAHHVCAMRAPTEGWSRQPAALPWRKCGFDSRWALFSAGRRKAWYSAGHRREALVAGARDRGFKSRRPDFNCGGACVGTGGRLLSVMSQVRFLPPQPGNGRASQLAMAAAPKAAER